MPQGLGNSTFAKTAKLFVVYAGLVTFKPIVYFAIRYFGWKYEVNADSGYAPLTRNVNTIVAWTLCLAEMIILLLAIKRLNSKSTRIWLSIFICLQLLVFYFSAIFPLTV